MTDHPELPNLPASSVMNRVRPFEWDQGAAVRYEVALEVFSQEIGACTGRIHAEEAKDVPDPSIIGTCRAAMTRLAQERRALDSNDHAAITRVLAGAQERIEAWDDL